VRGYHGRYCDKDGEKGGKADVKGCGGDVGEKTAVSVEEERECIDDFVGEEDVPPLKCPVLLVNSKGYAK